MESQAKTCQKVVSKGSCKCDKCRVQKADKWLLKKQPSVFSMCYQFRKAYIDEDQPTLEQFQGIFGFGRCLCCGYTLLHLAVSVGSKDLVEYYLNRNHSVCMRTDNGETALHLACALGDSWLVEKLLTAEADVHAIDDLGCTPLQICLSRAVPSAAILKVLLDHGARPNKLFSSGEDIEELIVKMIKANARNSSGILPLYEAVHKGDYAAAQQLLNDGACPNSLSCYRRSLLQVACYIKSVECAEALVNAGANVNESDLEGRTALHYAIISESTEILKILLANNSDLWARDSDGYTALGMAALTNRLQVTDQLLDHGARCTEVLLMEVLERQCTDVALSILRRCYFRVHDTKFGRTLLYCAIATGQQQVVAYLQSLGVEVAYEGSDDEEEDVPVVPCYASLVAKTAVSARVVSSSFVAYESMESSSRTVDNPRHPSSVQKTVLPASCVPSKFDSCRSTDYSIRKMVHHKAIETTRKRTYVSRPHDMVSNSTHHGKQSRYAGIVDVCPEYKLRTRQPNGIARSKTCDTIEKNRRGHEEQSSRKFIVSDDKEVSLKHRNAIRSNFTKISSPKTDSTKNPNVKKKSLKPQVNENVNSLFHFYCQEGMNSKLTTYEGMCFKSFSKDDKVKNASSNVDTFFKFYKYCVQYK